jgi:hypothetical protein
MALNDLGQAGAIDAQRRCSSPSSANEDAAYDELVRVYHTDLHVAYRMLGESNDAADAAGNLP